jgi:hypothetical protein
MLEMQPSTSAFMHATPADSTGPWRIKLPILLMPVLT